MTTTEPKNPGPIKAPVETAPKPIQAPKPYQPPKPGSPQQAPPPYKPPKTGGTPPEG